MLNIRELRIGDIVTYETKYKGYKYSIIEGIDSISLTIRHREIYEDGGRQMAISSCVRMSPLPLSNELLAANGWSKTLFNEEAFVQKFESVIIGLRPSVFGKGFVPILFQDDSCEMHEAIFMYEIEFVHELQALLDMWKTNYRIKI